MARSKVYSITSEEFKEVANKAKTLKEVDELLDDVSRVFLSKNKKFVTKLDPANINKLFSYLNGKWEILSKEEKNKQHLQFIYDRMIEIHKENPNYDYMLKFKEIIS